MNLIRQKGKKAQTNFDISFSMIFSVIIIIAIIVVAFYVIRHFLGLNSCTQLELFFTEFKEEVDKAWVSDIYSGEFNTKLYRGGVSHVCFGELSSDIPAAPDDEIKREELREINQNAKGNVFLYPPKKACKGKLWFYNATRSQTSNFFCIPIKENGEIKVQFEKEIEDELVSISKHGRSI